MTAGDARLEREWSLSEVCYLCAAVALSLLAYHGILGSYFLHDDFMHFYEIANGSWTQLLFKPFAGHLYVLRNALWAMMYRLAGTNPTPYFAFMLSLHLCAVGLLFALVRRLTASAAVACMVAATWGASPLNVGVLDWFSAYGLVLALVLALVALCEAAGASARGAVSRRTALVWAVCLVGSAASFGTGLGLAMCSPLVLWLLVPPGRRGRDAVWWWWLLAPAVVVPLYAACEWMYPPSGPEMAAGTAFPSGLAHVDRVVLMALALLGFGTSSAILGPTSALVAGSGPVSMLVTLGFWLLVASGWWRGDACRRRAIVALGLAALCQYAVIAVGRASLYRIVGVTGAEAARYHYGPTAMFTAMAGLAADALLVGFGTIRFSGGLVAASWLAWSANVLVRHPIPIDPNASARAEASTLVNDVRAFAECMPAGAPIVVPNRPFQSAGPLLLMNPDVFPGRAAAFTMYFDDNVVAGHRVFFVDPDAKSLAAARALRGSRIAELLVSPDELPVAGVPEPVCDR